MVRSYGSSTQRFHHDLWQFVAVLVLAFLILADNPIEESLHVHEDVRECEELEEPVEVEDVKKRHLK